MSAIVCGSKRSYYHFDEEFPSTPPVSKRLRCSSSSPPSRSSPLPPLFHLKSLFPLLDPQVLEKALEECGNDLESAVKTLNQEPSEQGALLDQGDATASNNLSTRNLPVDGAEWVDLLVKEMMSAASVDDAKVRASRVLETLEKAIRLSAAADDTAQSIQKESMMLKEQIEALIRDNTILKRAVAIQHERQKEFEDKNRELEQLKQLVSQYQEQLKTLEVNNYALMMHLRQAEQCTPIPGRFHPDVF